MKSLLLEEILPREIAVAEVIGELEDAFLFPIEEAIMAHAAAKRRMEFATVRRCARAALTQFDVFPGVILPGPNGAPIWPHGFVGSMTHCIGYCGAAVARASQIYAIGVDAEPNEPLPREAMAVLLTPHEIASVRWLTARNSDVCWDRLLFSAKETVFKAWFPVTGHLLRPDEVSISVDLIHREFSVHLNLSDEPTPQLKGSWRMRDGISVTGLALHT